VVPANEASCADTAYEGLVRNNRVPWEGRDEDEADAGVWAVTCPFTRRDRPAHEATGRGADRFLISP